MRAWHGLFLPGSSAKVQDEHFPTGDTTASCLAFQNFTVHLGSEAALFPIIFLQPHITTRDRQFPPVSQGPALLTPLWSSFLQECSWARGRSTAETWDSTNQFCALPLPPILHRPQNLSFEIPLEKMREKERHKGTAFTWCEWHRGCSLQLSKTPVASILQQVSNLRPACPPRRPRIRIPCQGPGASRALRCFVVPTSLAGRGKAHTGGRIPAGSFATR